MHLLLWFCENTSMNTDAFSSKNTKLSDSATAAQEDIIFSNPSPDQYIDPYSLSFMWDTRPVRFPKKQKSSVWAAGICEGIAVRYCIDPMLVRVAFVVTAIFGVGIGLYLILWLCLPRYSVDRAPIEVLTNNHGGKYNHDQSTGWIISIILAPSIGAAFNFTNLSSLATLALIALAWWGLHRRAPYPPQGLIAAKPTITFRDPVDLNQYQPAVGFHSPQFAPQWDPLLIDANTTYIPSPTVETTENIKKWPSIVVGVILLAVLATATTAGFNAVSSSYKPDVGDVTATVSSEAEIAPSYSSGFGNVTVDFSKLEKVTNDHHVSTYSEIGDQTITLPRNVRFEVFCSSDVGDVNCPTGVINSQAKGGLITLDLHTDLGNINVKLKD